MVFQGKTPKKPWMKRRIRLRMRKSPSAVFQLKR
jgi:hypothetical protein